jgi:hypothetical protein
MEGQIPVEYIIHVHGDMSWNLVKDLLQFHNLTFVSSELFPEPHIIVACSEHIMEKVMQKCAWVKSFEPRKMGPLLVVVSDEDLDTPDVEFAKRMRARWQS